MNGTFAMLAVERNLALGKRPKMILYGHPLSENAHKVRMLLSALGVPYQERVVDVLAGAQKRADFLALNPRGQVPVLVDADVTIYDAQAILVYLARRYDPEGRWLPLDARDMAKVVGWLVFAANEIQNSAHLARTHFLLGLPVEIERVQQRTRETLALLNAHLSERGFLELERPSLADIACFPSVVLAPEGKVSLAEYPHVRAWIRRMRGESCFVPMQGMGEDEGAAQ
jgi:glutathione S-transferase